MPQTEQILHRRVGAPHAVGEDAIESTTVIPAIDDKYMWNVLRKGGDDRRIDTADQKQAAEDAVADHARHLLGERLPVGAVQQQIHPQGRCLLLRSLKDRRVKRIGRQGITGAAAKELEAHGVERIRADGRRLGRAFRGPQPRRLVVQAERRLPDALHGLGVDQAGCRKGAGDRRCRNPRFTGDISNAWHALIVALVLTTVNISCDIFM